MQNNDFKKLKVLQAKTYYSFAKKMFLFSTATRLPFLFNFFLEELHQGFRDVIARIQQAVLQICIQVYEHIYKQ